MRNIGPTSLPWLHEIGIYNRDDLVAMGSVMAYQIIRHRRPETTLLLLYALEGAVRDCHWNDLSRADKAALKAAATEPLTTHVGDRNAD